MTEPVAPAKVPLKIRIEQHLAEYGPVALGVYFTIFAAVLIGFVIAIRLGFTSACTRCQRDLDLGLQNRGNRTHRGRPGRCGILQRQGRRRIGVGIDGVRIGFQHQRERFLRIGQC